MDDKEKEILEQNNRFFKKLLKSVLYTFFIVLFIMYVLSFVFQLIFGDDFLIISLCIAIICTMFYCTMTIIEEIRKN